MVLVRLVCIIALCGSPALDGNPLSSTDANPAKWRENFFDFLEKQ
jgi:hypothetical protein